MIKIADSMRRRSDENTGEKTVQGYNAERV